MKYLLFILFLLGGGGVRAQQHAFLVYNVNGGVQVNKAGKTSVAQKGQWLDSTEKITVGQNAQVTLVCQSYRPVVLAKKGTYPVSAFSDSCKHTESFSTAYFHYIWEEFSHEHKTVEEDRHHYMKNYGAAVRGGNCTNAIESRLTTINYRKGPFYLSWNGKDAGSVNLLLYDGDKKVATITPSGDHYLLDSVALRMGKPGKYYWAIKPKDQRECSKYELIIVGEKEFQAFSSSLLNTAAAVTRDNAERYFMLAFMYEERHYFANAWQYYKKAVAANPGQERYKKTLSSFEKQYGLAGR